MSEKSVAVIGLGYVGLPLALLAVKKDFKVVGIDKDEKKITSIKNKTSPFYDQEIDNELKYLDIEVTSEYTLVKGADIVIVCVPTPVDKNFMPDLTLVKSVCKDLAKHINDGQLIIIESTINPGVCDEIIIPLIEKESGKKCGKDFSLAHCPERINPGDQTYNVSNIARVVGAQDLNGLEKAHDFYSHLIDAPIKKMNNLKEAEAVKVVENSFRDINIAFVNELAMSFTKLGIDVVNVIDGAATKPFSFMAHYPGVGVGGHCIPVDPYYLIEYARINGFDHKFLTLAREINNEMPDFTIERLENALQEAGSTLKDSNITVLGLSYKANVGDLRESPSLKLIELLQNAEAQVAVYDPYINSYKNLPDNHGVENSGKKAAGTLEKIEASMTGANAVVIATAHDEFKAINIENMKKLGVTIIVDGRNCLDKDKVLEAGIIYRGIGR